MSRNVEEDVPYSQLKQKIVMRPFAPQLLPTMGTSAEQMVPIPPQTTFSMQPPTLQKWIEADPRLFYKVDPKLLDL